MPSFTVQLLLGRIHTRLKRARLAHGHGMVNAWDEAVYLVLHALNLPPDRLTPYLERAVPSRARARAVALASERIRRRIPAAYLTHEAWLGDYRFYVDERVIVPRSYIAELLRERLAPWLPSRRRVRSVLDLCTGSGCLAIIAANTFNRAKVDAVDIDRAALAVAERNIASYRLKTRVRALHSDMFSAVRGRRYDVIIANPPYVNAAAMRKLPREYRHEPRIALASGRDGLDAVRVILREAAGYLGPHGLLVVEVGHYRQRIEAAFPHYAFVWPDTSGGDDCVFILERRELLRAAAASQAQTPAPRPASRAAAASRRR
ncbi:MAG: 50S ribosomal protein L3 N(5)-glutamine methyltransferase [Burkholderiales bacterium]